MNLLWIAGLLLSLQLAESPDSLTIDYHRKSIALIQRAEYVPPANASIAADQEGSLTLSVRSSPSSLLESKLTITSTELDKVLINANEEENQTATSAASYIPDIYLSFKQNTVETRYRLEQTGDLWNETTNKKIILPRKAAEKLLLYANIVRKKHYGELIPWGDASSVIPLKSVFSITDLESGLTFQVQRRAGKSHADVQPLTKEDSKVMKQIYQGEWSWRRRAILVHSENQWLAASMNGMPHGGDGIPGNGFSGHFCVHFLNSTTHKSNYPDLAHQLMVNKSAGALSSFFLKATPQVLAESFIEAMNQHDSELLRQALVGVNEETIMLYLAEMDALMIIQPDKRQDQMDDPDPDSLRESLSAEVIIKAVIQKRGSSKRKANLQFSCKRDSTQLPWHIVHITKQ